MEESLKYFTPEISDIRVGYECEANISIFKIEDQWTKCIIKGVGSEVIEYHKKGIYRTPYLTKEQIEAEGWKYEYQSMEGYELFVRDKWHVCYSFSKRKLEIYLYNENGDYTEDYFKGNCPSINEFRTIMKLLNIK